MNLDDSLLLLPIEIVVRKFRFDNFFIRLTLSFALPLIYSLSIVNELLSSVAVDGTV